MIPIYVYLIIIVFEAIIIAVVIHKGIRQVERANYWKEALEGYKKHNNYWKDEFMKIDPDDYEGIKEAMNEESQRIIKQCKEENKEEGYLVKRTLWKKTNK